MSKDQKIFSKDELDHLIMLHAKHEGSWASILAGMEKKFKKSYTAPQLQSRFYQQSYSSENFWSKEQKDELVRLKHMGLESQQIAYQLQRKFGAKRSPESVMSQYRRLIDSGEYKEKKGHDFTKQALGEIKRDSSSEKDKIYVIAAVSPMTAANRSPDYFDNKSGKKNDDKDAIEFEPNLHKAAFATLLNYVKRNGAELCLLPMRAHMRALEGQPFHYDEELKPYKKNFVTDMSINGGVLRVIEAHLNPQQISPTTGMGQLSGKKNKFIFQDVDEDGKLRDAFDKNRSASIIVAHPKQALEVHPTGMESTPRVVHSTGSLTDPQYIANRIGRLAEEAHTLGFLIVEVRGRKFFIRQVQCDPRTGEFCSMGVRYKADGSAKRERADTMVFGDLHAGAHDPVSLDCAFEMMRYFRPKHTVWHDVHDGKSYTHHDQKKMLTYHRNPACFKSLEAEGEVGRQVLSLIDTVNKEVGAEGHIIDGSNHNKHLSQFLDEERFSKEKVNNDLASELFVCAKRGLNPLRVLIDSGSDDPLEVLFKGYKSKFTWHESNTDWIRWGVQLNQHGHEGTGGVRGSKHHHSLAYTNSITAHTHQPAIFNGAYICGTLSLLRLSYNNGPQNWMHAHVVMYDKGMREMIVEIKGEWCLKDAPYRKIGWEK